MIRLALPLLLLLAGCARGGYVPIVSGPAETPAQAACRRESLDSDRVKLAMREQPSPGNVTWRARWERELRDAQTRATNECLRRQGLAGGIDGGVEAPRLLQ